MHRRSTMALVAVTVGGLLTTACSGGGPSGNGGNKLSNNKIVLGVLTDLSGVYSDIAGKKTATAVQMAVDDFKKKYGSKAITQDITVISADHQDKPDVAKTQAQAMFERKNVDAIFDVPTSSAALAVAAVAKQDKKIYMNVGAASMDLSGKSCNKYTFAYAYDAYMLANGTGTTVTKNGGKNWYIIYPDYAFGQDMSAAFDKFIKAAGGNIVKQDPTPFPNDNFSTFLLKASTLSPKPDIFGAMQAGGDLVNVAKQYNQFKLRDKGIKLAVGLMFDNDIRSIGQDTLAGTEFTTAWYWNLDDQSKAWAQAFKAKAGVMPNFDQAGAYSAATQYLEAVQAAGSDDADKVSAKLSGLKFNDMFAHNGEIRASDHRVVHDAYLTEVVSSKDASDPDQLVKLVTTIPAQQAFEPPSTECHLS